MSPSTSRSRASSWSTKRKATSRDGAAAAFALAFGRAAPPPTAANASPTRARTARPSAAPAGRLAAVASTSIGQSLGAGGAGVRAETDDVARARVEVVTRNVVLQPKKAPGM